MKATVLISVFAYLFLQLPAELFESLHSDDECSQEVIGTDCAVNALQRRGIRLANYSQTVQTKIQTKTGFLERLSSAWKGWWSSIYSSVARPPPGSNSGKCSQVTSGTCIYLPCGSWRGPTDCVSGQCQCKEGSCANEHGVCINPHASLCTTDAFSTCSWMGCNSLQDHGDAQCIDAKCYCAPGQCYNAFNGKCSASETCVKDTGGTCKIGGCDSSRGPAECVNGKCLCPTGFCAKDNGAGFGVCALAQHPDYLAHVAAINQEQPVFPGEHGKIVTGLSFCGGGARALTNAMGAYRALEGMGLMQYVDSISSVSGGTWASSVYMFADMPKEQLLGKSTNPHELNLHALSKTPAAMGAAVTTSCHDFLQRLITNHPPQEKIWQAYIAEIILKPFDLDDPKAFMAGTEQDVQRIKRENPKLKDALFYTPRPGCPKVFVMGGTVLAPLGYHADGNVAAPLQMCPDFTGTPFWPDNKALTYWPAEHGASEASADVIVGGGMVETFAFGGEAPKGSQFGGGRANIDPPEQPFTLADAVGISSVAPGAQLAEAAQYQTLVPQRKLWPVMSQSREPSRQEAKMYTLGDGGSFENSGMLALLQRKAKKVVMFVSTYIPLSSKRYPKLDMCNPPAAVTWERLLGDNDDLIVAPMVSDKFGFPYNDTGSYYVHNQVFAKEELPAVLCSLQTLRNQGKPAVYRSSHRVVRNDWWGIEGGFNVDLVIVYLEQVTEFEDLLPQETRIALGPRKSSDRTWKTSNEFARYPHYLTTGQTEEKTEITRLTNAEVNLLAAQSEYVLRQNEGVLRQVLCPDGYSPAALCCRNPTSYGCR